MPLVHGLNPRKIWGYAIGSLGRRGGAAPANAGKPALLQAGERVGADHKLT
jgi:hypothetical protein